LIGLLIYSSGVVFTYGYTVAIFQRTWPTIATRSLAEDRFLSVIAAVLSWAGAATTFAVFFFCGRSQGYRCWRGWRL
jgi:hypothetical protein